MANQIEVPLPPISAVFPHIHADPADVPGSIDPFTITTSTGFLPIRAPATLLPRAFDGLTEILREMPVVKADGSPGLLARFMLGPLIDGGGLTDLTHEVDDMQDDDGNPDMTMVTAAFRDYSFLASAYLLEPCWERWSKDHSEGFGLGRQLLPECISGPLVRTAEILDIPPFMSYAASYALYNYHMLDPAHGARTYDNLSLIRAFENGLNPKSSEAGFILTHVHMVSFTGELVEGAINLLEAADNYRKTSSNVSTAAAEDALRSILHAMKAIEASMEKMWSNSLPKDYISYRTFIFGITSQSMFPDGVVYQGQFENKPQYFRGESGANDSIIPLLDYLCEVPMPTNPLTDILRDFKSYRPHPHRQFLSYVQSKSTELGISRFCAKDAGPTVASLYLKVLDHVRSFRWRHWLFAREYIIKRTLHPTATGGSPIVTWLPNQLSAVLEMMQDVYHESGLHLTASDSGHELKWLQDMMENVVDQKVKLQKEVSKYCEERGV